MKEITKYSLVTAFSLSLVFSIIGPATAFAATSPSLGGNSTYGIVSSTYTNSLNTALETAITGDVCYTIPPGTAPISISGATVNPCADARGTDQSTALANINGQGGCTDLGVNVLLAGTYAPGCYTSSGTMGITTGVTVTLSGAGTYIFRSGGAFTTGSNSAVVLGPGASACDVFWAPTGDMLIGANSSTSATPTFVGNILQNSGAAFNVTLGHFVNLLGRVLAFGRTVTTDSNTIKVPTGCAVAAAASAPGVVAPLPPVFTPPLINVTKIPTPLALPAGPGSVTYDYVVSNVGTVPIFNVTVSDNKCAPVSYVSGDTNANSRLGTTETWRYRCTTTLSQTTANTVTATGQGSSGLTTTDTADAIVVVGAPLVPPLIHLVKVPNVFVLPAGGGVVTYSYSVTNPGTVPLSDISITDNKCTGLPSRVVGHPGDINKNNLLDPGETFHFTCQTNLTQTTTNIGTATGHANGFTITDTSPATVVVAPSVVVPKLPNTGFPSSGTSTPWDAVIAIGILMLVSSSLVALKKHRV